MLLSTACHTHQILSEVDCELHNGLFLCTPGNAQYSTRTEKKPIYRILTSTVFNILSATDYFGLLCINPRNTGIPTMVGKLALSPCKEYAWKTSL